MRILQLTDFYRPVIGGLERHVETLARQLTAGGHHVAVAALAHPRAPDHELLDGIEVFRLRGWHRLLMRFYQAAERPFHPTVPDPGITRALHRIVQREQPDIIHAHGWVMHSLLPLVRAKNARAVVTLHDYGLVCPTKTLLRGGKRCPGPSLQRCITCAARHYGPIRGPALAAGMAMSTPLYGMVDGYISVSDSVARANQERMRGAPSTVISTLLPDSDYTVEPSERPPFLPPHDGYILFVGVLAPHKGVEVLLDAYRELCDPPPLVLIGTPYGLTRLRYPLGVTVHRCIAHDQVMAAWKHSGIAVVPSCWDEPLPSVLLEAMLSKKPIVASAVGGIPECVRNGESALLVPPGDRQALRQALQQLVDDHQLRDRLAGGAFKRAQAYRASVVAGAVMRFYLKVLSESRG